MNAGATIYAADLAASLGDGVEAARAVLDSGKGLEKLDQLVAVSNSFG